MNASFSLCSEVNYSKTSKITGGIILKPNNSSQKEVTKKYHFSHTLLTTVLEKTFLAKTRRSCGTKYKEKGKICLASVYWCVENYFLTEFATICESALNIFLNYY